MTTARPFSSTTATNANVIDEVDIQEKLDFRLGEMAFYFEEAPVKRLLAAASDGRDQVCSIVGSKRPDFDAPSVAQRLKCRIVGCFRAFQRR
jgi:hypothetical protein